MPEVAAFAEFYRAVNGWDPLPWQSRLAHQVAAQGWPQEIGVPTGLGKTSCLDIATWALAQSANSGGGQLPTRTWYVVNRRLLVDAAFEHAEYLRDLLAGSLAQDDQGAIGAVARALAGMAAFGAEGGPLYVARLRGGAELGARPPDPSQPALLLATVPMFASRWLFRGYGSSATMRPVDAAHAGIDSLVLLDEAHLARPLLHLAGHAASCDTGDPSSVFVGASLRCRPIVVAMTATGEAAGDRFDLDESDRANPIVAKRLHAAKQGQLVGTTTAKLAEVLSERALVAIDDGNEACVVFANTPRTARDVAEHLKFARRKGRELDVLLVTGRVRDWEADRLRERLLDPVLGVRAGHRRQFDRPLVVVATQTLEVGADVDFDHLVTETAGVRSLVQRLGRVNRLGDRAAATCTFCHPIDGKAGPVYGDEPGKVWARLQSRREAGDNLDLSPSNVSTLLGLPGDCPPRVGELLPAHLWEWAKTTTPPAGEAPVELFFDGFSTDTDVSVIWRAHRPEAGARLLPVVSEREAVDIPVSEVHDVLKGRQIWRLADDKASLEEVDVNAVRPGDVVVLCPDDGLYDEVGWNPQSKERVLDVSAPISGILLLHTDVLENLAPGCLDDVRSRWPELAAWLDGLTEPPDDDGLEGDPVDDSHNVAQLLAVLKECQPHPWLGPINWADFLRDLGTAVVRPTGPGADAVPWVGPARPKRRWSSVPVRSDAFEELSLAPSSLLLQDHLDAVGKTAAHFASQLGMPDELVKALRLAGECHDLGKHDPRFQRWLSPDAPPAQPLAKSGQSRERWESSRALSGWPRGGRHELLSTQLVSSWLEGHAQDCDTELVLHLVATHHGEGRPLVKVVEDPAPTTVVAEFGGEVVQIRGDLACPDWDQPRRFRLVCERYGLWGVALLEAILRQADWAVSSFMEVV